MNFALPSALLLCLGAQSAVAAPAYVERVQVDRELFDAAQTKRVEILVPAFREDMDIQVSFDNEAPPAAPNFLYTGGLEPISVKVNCDGIIRRVGLGRKGTTVSLVSLAGAGSAFRFLSPYSSCEAEVSSVAFPKKFKIYLRTDASVQLESLPVPAITPGSADNGTDSVILLETRESGLNAKVQALLGRPLSAQEIASQDPGIPLESSRIPELDSIFLSTLVFKNDFYGNIISRLLKLHADRGAKVRVAVADVLVGSASKKKSRDILRDLELYSPNIKTQRYRYDSKFNLHPIRALHRALHAKLLITRSAAHPGNDRVIFGGRNIDDCFLFESVPDFRNFPKLIQYTAKEYPFVPFEDLEYELRSSRLAQTFAHLFSSFWFRDSFSSEPWSMAKREEYRGGSSLRPFFSVPFADDRELLDQYVQAIDEAQESIRIVTPYFLPEKQMEAALRRATARGVKIEVVTQIVLTGDDFPKVAENVNKSSVNRYWKMADIYSWGVPGTIIHSKVLLIDRRLALVGSVNFDVRSFYHDMEAGLIVRDPKLIDQLHARVDHYKTKSQVVGESFEINPAHYIWLKLLKNIF